MAPKKKDKIVKIEIDSSKILKDKTESSRENQAKLKSDFEELINEDGTSEQKEPIAVSEANDQIDYMETLDPKDDKINKEKNSKKSTK
jgi:hypothetical protein